MEAQAKEQEHDKWIRLMCEIALTLCIRDITYYPAYRILLYFLQQMFTYFLSDCVIKFKNSNYYDSGAVSLFLSLASISELDFHAWFRFKPQATDLMVSRTERFKMDRDKAGLARDAHQYAIALIPFHSYNLPEESVSGLQVVHILQQKPAHAVMFFALLSLWSVFLVSRILGSLKATSYLYEQFFVHLSSAWKTSQWIESRCVSWSKRQMVEVKSKSLSCAWESWMDMGGAWWGNISRNAQLSDVWFDTWRHKQALQNLFM